jgi:hypothetical protein
MVIKTKRGKMKSLKNAEMGFTENVAGSALLSQFMNSSTITS